MSDYITLDEARQVERELEEFFKPYVWANYEPHKKIGERGYYATATIRKLISALRDSETRVGNLERALADASAKPEKAKL